MKKILGFIAMVCFCLTTSFSQELRIGIRAGVELARFSGPSEIDVNGNDLESNTWKSGFHFGISTDLKFSDRFGLLSDIVFVQAGTRYDYQGDGQLWLKGTVNNFPHDEIITGDRSDILTVNNAYLEIPIRPYIRFGRLRLGAGISLNTLLISKANGEVKMTGRSKNDRPTSPETIAFNVEANYFTDPSKYTPPNEPQEIIVDNLPIIAPTNVNGYAENEDVDENYFNRFDVAVIGDVSFFLNSGLYLSFAFSQGLLDITNNNVDFYKNNFDDAEQSFPRSDDKDIQQNMRISLGFSF